MSEPDVVRFAKEAALSRQIQDAYVESRNGMPADLVLGSTSIGTFAAWLCHVSGLVSGAGPEWVSTVAGDAYEGTLTTGPIGPIVGIMCMAPEARDLLDLMMVRYEPSTTLSHDDVIDQGIYGFAYWLCRYSGLIRPTAEALQAIREGEGDRGDDE